MVLGFPGFFQGVDHDIRADLVHAVAVFPVDVVGNHHLRLVMPEELDHVVPDLVLADLLVGRLHVHGVAVVKFAQEGIGPLPGGPQPVQQLRPAGGGALGNPGRHHLLSPLRAVIGNHGPEENILIVRVGHHHQQVRLFRRGLPHLHLRRPLPGGIHPQLMDAQGRRHLVVGGDAELRHVLQGGPGGQVVLLVLRNHGPFPAALHLDTPVGLDGLPFDLHPGAGFPLRQLHLQPGILFPGGFPVISVIPVVQVADIGGASLFPGVGAF